MVFSLIVPYVRARMACIVAISGRHRCISSQAFLASCRPGRPYIRYRPRWSDLARQALTRPPARCISMQTAQWVLRARAAVSPSVVPRCCDCSLSAYNKTRSPHLDVPRECRGRYISRLGIVFIVIVGISHTHKLRRGAWELRA